MSNQLDKRFKVKSTPKKPKAKEAKSAALGIGDAYAYGVAELTEKAKEKGSDQESWLGVTKQTLDPNAFVARDKLHVKK